MPSGFITLGELARFRQYIAVACIRCDRRGRLSVPRLIAQHGLDMPVPKLRQLLAGDCRGMIENKIHDPCGVHFPGLAG